MLSKLLKLRQLAHLDAFFSRAVPGAVYTRGAPAAQDVFLTLHFPFPPFLHLPDQTLRKANQELLRIKSGPMGFHSTVHAENMSFDMSFHKLGNFISRLPKHESEAV